jgi:hypothetical protein
VLSVAVHGYPATPGVGTIAQLVTFYVIGAKDLCAFSQADACPVACASCLAPIAAQ